MLLSTLGASLLGNLLTGKAIVRASSGNKNGQKKLYKLVLENNGVFNAASSLNKF